MRRILKRIAFAPLCAALILCVSMVAHAETKAPVNYATAQSCLITAPDQVTYSAILSSTPVSDDGLYYLVEMATYEEAVDPAKVVASAPAGAQLSMNCQLFHKQPGTRLYSKFALCAKQGGALVMIANPQYITNPEVLATNTHPRSSLVCGEQGYDFIDIWMDTYKNTYSTRATAVQIMNNGQDPNVTNPLCYQPDSKPIPGGIHFYCLNAANQTGVNVLTTNLSNLAATCPTVDDWVIGNEVNWRQANYIPWVSWERYLQEYERSVRLAYNAIKSENANAQIYINVEITWDRNYQKAYYTVMDSKDFITAFAADIKQAGDIDWGLNYHAGGACGAWGKFWDKSQALDGPYVQNLMNQGKIVNFENIKIMTDYMQTPAMLFNNRIRHIISAETSLDNRSGYDVQAAALYASYVTLVKNPYIERVFYLNNAGISCNVADKSAEVFQAMLNGTADQYDAWAKSMIGSYWSKLKYDN